MIDQYDVFDCSYADLWGTMTKMVDDEQLEDLPPEDDEQVGREGGWVDWQGTFIGRLDRQTCSPFWHSALGIANDEAIYFGLYGGARDHD